MPRGVPKADKPRIDPLLAALIGKLPAGGSEWTAAAREAWLRMMGVAFDVVYGPSERPTLTGTIPLLDPERLTAIEERQRRYGGPAAQIEEDREAMEQGKIPVPFKDGHYHIAPDGYAMRDASPIDPADIPPGTIFHDYRSQPLTELDAIMWKTFGAKEMPLPAGVVIRPATEPYKGVQYNGKAMM